MSTPKGGCQQCYSRRGNLMDHQNEVKRLARLAAYYTHKRPEKVPALKAEIVAAKAAAAESQAFLIDHEAECTWGQDGAA